MLDAVAAPGSPAQAVAAATGQAAPDMASLPAGVATAQPIDLEAQALAEAPQPAEAEAVDEALPPGATATKPIDLSTKSAKPAAAPAPPAEEQAGRETAVHKSASSLPSPAPADEPPAPASDAPPVQVVQSVPIAPPEPPARAGRRRQGRAGDRAANPTAGPRHLQSPGQRARAAAADRADLARLCLEDLAAGASGYKLLSTHREAMPTAALLPGEYLVNAAYGLSNLTKKIKVESGRSLEETFVLNTGGLKLAAVLGNGEPLPDGSAVRFDIQSDEEDQFGNRHTILRQRQARPRHRD